MKNSRIKPGDLCTIGDQKGFKVRPDPDGVANGALVKRGDVVICIASSFVVFDEQKIADAFVLTNSGTMGWIIEALLRCESH